MRRKTALALVLSLCVSLCVLASGCAYPVAETSQGEDRPYLMVTGAPEGAHLVVDGIDAGPASQFTGDENALRVLPGQHVVKVVHQGRTIHEEKIFLGSGSSTTVDLMGPGE